MPAVLDLLERVLQWEASPAPSSSVVYSDSASAGPSRGRGLRLLLKLDHPLKTAVGGGRGSEGGVTGKLKASAAPLTCVGVQGSSSPIPSLRNHESDESQRQTLHGRQLYGISPRLTPRIDIPHNQEPRDGVRI